MASVKTLLRIVRTVRGRCHRTILNRSVIHTVHPAVATNGIDRPILVLSTTRMSSSRAATQPYPAPPTLECTNDGRKLKILWSDSDHSSFNSLWLRHNCTCPICWNSTTCQRMIKPTDLVGGPTIDTTEVCGSPDGTNKLGISWSYRNGSQHQGVIDLNWLRENSYSPPSPSKIPQRSMPLFATSLPKISYSDILKREEEVWKWMRHLNEYGMCLLTDIPTELGQIEKVVKSAGLFPVENFYGLNFDIIAKKEPTNLAYDSVELPLHMDLLYYESPPGLQLLHCIRNDACIEGGESVVLDSFAVAEEMREKHPQHFATLTRIPITFQRIDNLEKGLYTYQRPHISVDKASNIIDLFWNPILEAPLSIPEEDVASYYEAYMCLATMFAESDLKLYHLLQPGEALTFNNRRVLHARTAFEMNGGQRHFQTVYVNADDFKSRVRVLASMFS